MILNGYDFKRLVECVNCPYFHQCVKEVIDPQEDSDGTCKTRKEFESGSRIS